MTMSDSTGDRLQLWIPAKPEYLVLVRLALTGIARLRPIDPEDLQDLKLALTEAVSNSVLHAYQDGSGTVEVRVMLERDVIAIEVLDEGPGFERPPAEPDGELEVGGLGLAIIEAVVDDLQIDTREGGGSCIRFRKQLAHPVTDRTGTR